MTNAAPVAAAKRRLRKIERSSIGAEPRCSIQTQCQEIATRAPPRTGPITSPIAATIVFVPIAYNPPKPSQPAK